MDNVRESTEDLKNQLYHERTEGRRKLIAEKKKGSEGRDKNLSQKWKSILPGISASNSQKSKPDPEVNVTQLNASYFDDCKIFPRILQRQASRAPFTPPSIRIFPMEAAGIRTMTSFQSTSNGRAKKSKF